ncbi:MAG: DegT/DnrJ/EryC1/StrS family aminotransferase [Desulfuromonadales bacterium]|nr:DegT/DnrJ/EryC1/StrS family aminotransferase [Desulfuromonadales bacterium]
MTVRFLDLARQYSAIRDDIDAAIAWVIRDSAFIGGTCLATFEEAFATFQQAAHCVGVGNGTDAIEIALEALELPPGSDVLVPANSFIASSEAVTRAGHRVVFCDCDQATYTLSVEDVSRRITARTRAIIPVHLYGQPCDMAGVMALAAKHGLRVIEDCAQAHGAEWQGRRVGTIGDLGTFSFYPGKNLGAYGDGGAIVTNDEAMAKRCRMIANHGRIGKYDHEFEGRNSRLDGLQAAILGVKLQHLENWTARRIAVAALYSELLIGCPDITLPVTAAGARHVWHLFVVRAQRRDALKAHLAEVGIESGIHYPIALPKLAAYAYLGQADKAMVANRIDSELLSLPMGEHLSDENVRFVAGKIREFCGA